MEDTTAKKAAGGIKKSTLNISPTHMNSIKIPSNPPYLDHTIPRRYHLTTDNNTSTHE